ncbi:FAD-dependent oxidoreductase [Robbsia sp. Bb-Pol-6]|uniref:FAD-dependent oxidoreductase n=1 Tax=Robbsia betulipollinis TaxID=2981849 RepID=A0ABT3ZI80_9BURK|nr:FAD-dependent oxidoreductase [Robbsia betulipollinis]MCY0386221.1 FAD-dependent oxidoreductase [Robbsia betulipollinis]
MRQQEKGSVLVVGAGIVGLCTAYELRKAGFDVVVLDRSPVASECSSGNAGAISSRSVVPLAMPGLMKSVPGMLLDPTGPLYLPMSYLLRAAPWLVRFVASAKPERVAAISRALDALLSESVPLHHALAAEVGCPGRVQDTGQLHLYPDAAAMHKDRQGWAIKEAYGLTSEFVEGARIRELEPQVGPGYEAGLFLPDQAWVSDPLEYGRAIARAARERGVTFEQSAVRAIRRAGTAWEAETEAGMRRADQVVLAAGAWSARLLAPLGVAVPLESQRGYHVHVGESGLRLQRQVVLVDRKVFITQMESGLRVAGTVEFGGLERHADARRAALLFEHARRGLPALRPDAARTTWMGHRPCLPDSLPVIGPAPGHAGLWCAFGHGHLGLTGSAATARLMASALTGQLDPARLAPFSADRF